MKTTHTPAFGLLRRRQSLIGAALAGALAFTTIIARAAEAQAKGWTVVSMKDDWKTIFPPANE